MPFSNGIYIQSKDLEPFEFETNYYLDFHIKSALFSIDSILKKDSIVSACFDSDQQYYHFFCDHLLHSIGQISQRFYNSLTQEDPYYLKFESIIKNNIANYSFSKEHYPILCDKNYRHALEHINETNICIILASKGVGGFNVIDINTEAELANELRRRRENHPYTLDLQRRKIYLTKKSSKKCDIRTIDLDRLKKELISLQSSVKSVINERVSII